MSGPHRLLFHDTAHQGSLLSHLRVKDKIRLVSTATPVSPTAGYWAGITNIRLWPLQGGARFIPKRWTATRKKLVPFADWWSTEIVYLEKDGGKQVTRMALVTSMANKDGGVHVDARLDPTYEWVAEGTNWSMTVNPDDGPSETLPFKHAHLAAIRQIT
jgi:hypothetical protein